MSSHSQMPHIRKLKVPNAVDPDAPAQVTEELGDVSLALIENLCREQGWISSAEAARRWGIPYGTAERFLKRREAPSLHELSYVIGSMGMDPVDFYMRYDKYGAARGNHERGDVGHELMHFAQRLGSDNLRRLLRLADQWRQSRILSSVLSALESMSKKF